MADENKPVSGSSNADEIAKELRDQLNAYKKNLRTQVFRALTTLEGEILNNIRSASGLNVRTGALLNSVGTSKKVVTNSDGSVTGQIGSVGVPYARIHELGGTVTAKNKQFLAIPTDENRKRDGSPIVTTGELRTLQKLGLSFIANGVIFEKKFPTDENPVAMFILRKSVNIPARPYLSPAVEAKKEQILKDFGLFLVAAFPKKE